MQRIVSFIGKMGTGKTKALMEVIEREKSILNHPSSLLAILNEDEAKKYREILPNATILNKDNSNSLTGIKVLIADPIEYIEEFDIQMPNEIYFTSQNIKLGV